MRQKISGGSPFEPIIGFSRAVRVGNAVHLSGTGPVGADDEDAAGQTRRIFAIAADALAKAGATFDDVVRTRMYLDSRGRLGSGGARSWRILPRGAAGGYDGSCGQAAESRVAH